MPYAALGLRDPISVQARRPTQGDSFPKWSKIAFEFPATAARGAVKLFWYDGGQRPSDDLLEGKKAEPSGILMIGDKANDVQRRCLRQVRIARKVTAPEVTFVNRLAISRSGFAPSRGASRPRPTPRLRRPLTETIPPGQPGVGSPPRARARRSSGNAAIRSSRTFPAGAIHHPTYRRVYALRHTLIPQ